MYFAEKGYNKVRLFFASLAAYAKKVDKQKEEKEKEQQEERIKQAYQEGIDEVCAEQMGITMKVNNVAAPSALESISDAQTAERGILPHFL